MFWDAPGFLVIDPSRFEVDGQGQASSSVAGETAAFPARLGKYLKTMRNLPTAPGAPGPVLVRMCCLLRARVHASVRE